ncbi:hypothetical protein Hypma_000795 [Hypsizygus marmoreus]|uniref:Uncharacterized protein n=1 Tax=Hypsizygus marmoreus TaxID=39966 RepID=A0A369J8Z6_HYPMA|nr:hypothetical protein Hypma_000795 [Hypsizygus marmoreus]
MMIVLGVQQIMDSACKEAFDQLYLSSSGRFPRKSPIDGYTMDGLRGAASRSNRLTYTPAPGVALSSSPQIQELVTDAAIPSIPQFWRLMRHFQMDEAFGSCPEFVDMIFDHLIELPPAPGILDGKEWHHVEVVSLVFYGLCSLTRPDFTCLVQIPWLNRNSLLHGHRFGDGWSTYIIGYPLVWIGPSMRRHVVSLTSGFK